MRRVVMAVLVCLSVLTGRAYAVTPADTIVESIAARCADMRSMRCDFRQTRTVPLMESPQVSEGKMLYRQPSSLKWIYSEPLSYSFTIENDNISIDSPDGHTAVGSDAGRMFKGLSDIVLGCMSGKNLTDRRLFQTEVTVQDGEWVARLIPQRREMKRVFTSIVMVFDPSTALLKRMTMYDQNGGSTLVEISNVSVNADYEADW